MPSSRIYILAAVAVACSDGTPRGAAESRPAKTDLAARLDAIATRALAREGSTVAGVSLAVAWKGELVVARAYGMADVAAKVPARPDTIFRIASVTKQFTAAAIMKLVAAGKVGLDDEITRHLPDYPVRAQSVP